jgi:EAL domain-containing protein (putative c-di-GMP-specific phosphodiesterase class I)
MNDPAQGQVSGEEAILFDYAERLNKFRAGRHAIHVHLSRLRPYNRRRHHLRIAASAFEIPLQSYEGALFRLFNEDLVMIFKGAAVAQIDDYVLRLRYLFSEDPLLASEEDEGKEFCSWYDIEKDYAAFLSLAKRLVEQRAQEEAARAMAEAAQTQTEPEPAAPLDGPHLNTIITAIAQADISSMTRRQPICAVAGGQPPQPLFQEIYVSIDALRQTLLPSHDILADRWLFQALARHLDQRMLATLAKNDDETLQRAFSLNLSVETLLSPEFLQFDAALNEHTRHTVIIEVQLLDIFADLGSFAFIRDFLHDRGYRLCLDGTTQVSLPFVDREQLGVDLIKLQWSSDLIDRIEGGGGQELREAVSRQSAERLIMNRCDNETAIDTGRALGIALFQGHTLDRMIAEGISAEETVRSLSAAKARQRAASRRARQA